jgi:hypothetical protein
MTPETSTQIIAQIISYLGTTPVLLTVALMGLGPWGAMVWLSYKQDKRLTKVFERQDQRFEEVVRMYESNVQLVKGYESVVQNYHGITDNMQELIMLMTQTNEKLIGKIENNRFCPVVRQKIGPGVIEEERNG